jgi:hypothetical protein
MKKIYYNPRNGQEITKDEAIQFVMEDGVMITKQFTTLSDAKKLYPTAYKRFIKIYPELK